MAICPSCGASVPDGSRFCVECGTKLEAAPVIIDPPAPEEEPTLPEVPAMDIPIPEPPSVESDIPAAPAFEAVPTQEAEPAPVYVSPTAAKEAAPVYVSPAAAKEPAPVYVSPAAAKEAAPVYVSPAAAKEAAPVYVSPTAAKEAAPVYAAPKAEAPKPAPAFNASGASGPAPVYPQPAPASDKPGRKSKYAPMTSWGMAIQLILMNIPALGFVLMVIWACGGCRKIARRNLARANLILLIIAIILVIVAALLARFVFPGEITRIFEQLMPGYTIQWN